MLLIVQHIGIYWTKETRGGKGAVLRNAVPEALPLINMPSPADPLALICESTIFRGQNSYQKPASSIKTKALTPGEGLDFHCVHVCVEREQALVLYTYGTECAGAPRRYNDPRHFTLATGEWMRVMFNGRLTDWERRWYYQKTILNIGLFEKIARNAFLGEPTRIFSDMAMMW
jgi:hypothetical protein